MRTRRSFEKPLQAKASVLGLQRNELAPYQVRICVRCGHETTFVLEDDAGGWYSCVECGRYA
jgi:hypothetical protein